MRVDELSYRRVAIWGVGVEGLAALRFIRSFHPMLKLTLLDENINAVCPDEPMIEFVCGIGAIAQALYSIDVVIKSPGVPLYHPVLQTAKKRGVAVTSLLNLWFAQSRQRTTICVTGSKGKSTTSSLIAHALASLGSKADLVGNIGIPVTAANTQGSGQIVIEVSSYQAADFTQTCDIGVLTVLREDHLDWHGSPAQYLIDKTNLLAHSKVGIVNAESLGTVSRILGEPKTKDFRLFGALGGYHFNGDFIYRGQQRIGRVLNSHLRRPQNMSNLCAALTVIDELKFDVERALASVESFRGLPHRQQELGEIDGCTYVDDSISTIADSALKALAAYFGRRISIILGGFDRGIDYTELEESLLNGSAQTVICIGASGARIYDELHAALLRRSNYLHNINIYKACSMGDAVTYAKRFTPSGGVIILSPAAKSDGTYRNFIERGRDFAEKAGLPNPFYD